MKDTATEHGPGPGLCWLISLFIPGNARRGWYYHPFTKEKRLIVNNSPKVTQLAREEAEIQSCTSKPPICVPSFGTYPSQREHLFLLKAPK